VKRVSIVCAIACAVVLLTGCADARSQSAGADSRPNAERGRILTAWYGCASCHQLGGIPNSGRVGPPLIGVGRRSYLAGRLPNTPENLIQWIRFPQQIDPQTIMPGMGVTAGDARDIASFLYSMQ
jgi:cytochrome c